VFLQHSFIDVLTLLGIEKYFIISNYYEVLFNSRYLIPRKFWKGTFANKCIIWPDFGENVLSQWLLVTLFANNRRNYSHIREKWKTRIMLHPTSESLKVWRGGAYFRVGLFSFSEFFLGQINQKNIKMSLGT